MINIIISKNVIFQFYAEVEMIEYVWLLETWKFEVCSKINFILLYFKVIFLNCENIEIL